jgi:hypothetical protein
MKVVWVLSIIVVFLAIGCSGIEGQQIANPRTVLQFNPQSRTLEFYNSKDVNVTIKKASFNAETKQFDLDELNVSDNASKVRESNVGQIEADERRIAAIYTGLAQYTEAWGNLLSKALAAAGAAAPGFSGWSPSPIWAGGLPGAAPAGWQNVSAELEVLKKEVLALKAELDTRPSP